MAVQKAYSLNELLVEEQINRHELAALASSKLFLQFVLAVSSRVIFECAVYRITESLKEVHIPVASIDHHNTSAVFLRFPLDIRKKIGT